MSKNTNSKEHFKQSIKFFTSVNPVIALSIIAIIGLIIRIFYFPYDIPIVLDGIGYFWYANDLTILKEFPTGHTFPNNGWPTFLSLFFSFLNSNNFLDYMNMQRAVAVAISVVTIIPVYLLCRKFFDNSLAVLGSALFILDPRIIINSLLGITEPLFILLGTTSILFSLSDNRKLVYTSFGTAALFSLVRYEGLLLIIPLSILFFIRFKKERRIILGYLPALFIFVIVLLPMVYIRIETTGDDGLISHLIAGGKYVEGTIPESNNFQNKQTIFDFFGSGIINLVKYLGWVSFPIFFIFLPYGIFKILGNRNDKKIMIILLSVFFLLPAFYAYGREFQETRYLYIMFPIFSILSLYTIERINKKFNKPTLIFVLVICGVLVTSVAWMEYKGMDVEHEREAFLLAFEVNERTFGINEYYPESTYLDITRIDNSEFPILRNSIGEKLQFIPSEDINSIEEYIQYGKDKGLTHLVVDGLFESQPYRSSFFNELFFHEDDFPYLIKEFDSHDHDFKYHIKIFKIDYENFDFYMNASTGK